MGLSLISGSRSENILTPQKTLLCDGILTGTSWCAFAFKLSASASLLMYIDVLLLGKQGAESSMSSKSLSDSHTISHI